MATAAPILLGKGSGDPLSGANTVGVFTFTANAATAAGDASPVAIASFTHVSFLNDASKVVFAGLVEASVRISTRPEASGDDARMTEDESIDIDVLGNEDDDDAVDTLVVVGKTDGMNGFVDLAADGTLTYTPKADFHGTDSFTDGRTTAPATVSVTVEGVNDAPVSADVLEGAAATLVDVLAGASDVDVDDVLSVAGADQHDNGEVRVVENEVRQTPDLDFDGTDSFVFRISDRTVTTEQTATITVAPVNDDSTAMGEDVTLDEGDPPEIAVLANDFDIDGDIVQFGRIGEATNGDVSKDGNVLI